MSAETQVSTREEARIFPEAAHFYIPSLDGIRALAIAIVFVSHAGWGNIVPGGLGVTIFFFLSGYLITTLMRREAERAGGVDLGKFYLRRVLRILPPYYLVLLVATATMATMAPSSIRPAAILAQFLQVTNYFQIAGGEGIPPGLGVAWSLAVEEHFYLLFPLLYIFLRKSFGARGQASAILALCALVLAWRCVLVYVLKTPEIRTYEATDTRFDSLLFGCFLAVHRNPMFDRDPASRGPRPVDLAWAFVGFAAILATLVVRNPGFRETARYTIQGLAMIPLFSAAIRFPDWIGFRALNIGWVRFLGVLSYSLYLVHHAILMLLERTTLPKVPRAALSLVISVAISYAIYRLVEVPCARLRKRLSRAG